VTGEVTNRDVKGRRSRFLVEPGASLAITGVGSRQPTRDACDGSGDHGSSLKFIRTVIWIKQFVKRFVNSSRYFPCVDVTRMSIF
jgi:hypothetical protein